MQANWIGRSEGMLVRWALEKSTAPKGHTELEVYTTRPDTLFGASFMAVAADHPLAKAAAENNPDLAAFCEECRRIGTSVAELESGGEEGLRHRHPSHPSFRQGLAAAGLRRQLHPHGLRHRRHLRLPVRRSARPRFRAQIRPARRSGHPAARREDADTFVIKDKAYDGDGTMINSRFLDGLDTKAAFEEVGEASRNRRSSAKSRSARARSTIACATGASRASAIGAARSPSSIAKTCGVVPVPDEGSARQAA